MLFKSKVLVNSSVLHSVVLGEDGVEYIYELTGKGEWFYGHLSNLKLFEKGRAGENIAYSDFGEKLELMAEREKEFSIQWWEDLVEEIMLKGYEGPESIKEAAETKADEYNGPNAAVSLALRRDTEGDITQIASVAHDLYIKELFPSETISVSEEPSAIGVRILLTEYVNGDFTYWYIKELR